MRNSNKATVIKARDTHSRDVERAASLLFGIAIARAQKNLTHEGPKQQWNIHGAIYTQ